jgi:ribosome-associated protein
MDDIVKQNRRHEERKEAALSLTDEISAHKGENPILIDLSGKSDWTDFFLISTVSSLGHLKGLVRNVKEKLSELNIEVLHRHKRIADDGWELIDCGFLVIHLMTKEMREFYDLERLWFEGTILYPDHSSKSS